MRYETNIKIHQRFMESSWVRGHTYTVIGFDDLRELRAVDTLSSILILPSTMKKLNSEINRIKFCFPDAVICILMTEVAPLSHKTLSIVDGLFYLKDRDDLNLLRLKNIIKESKVRLAKSRNAVDYFIGEGTIQAFNELSPRLSFIENILLVKILRSRNQDLNVRALSESFLRFHLVASKSQFLGHLNSLFEKLEKSGFREQLKKVVELTASPEAPLPGGEVD